MLQEIDYRPELMIEHNAAALRERFDNSLEDADAARFVHRAAELFQEIVNGFLVNKKLILNKEEGYKIVGSADGETIPLRLLSSGEQHMMNMFFDLIFNSGSLVMIDEPELSLHIAWQMRFVDSLMKVRKFNGCRFLLATHSPAIVADYWDYVVDLEV